MQKIHDLKPCESKLNPVKKNKFWNIDNRKTPVKSK